MFALGECSLLQGFLRIYFLAFLQMVHVEPSGSGKSLATMVKGVVMQPILFMRALPYVTAQLSTYGAQFIGRPVIWMALAAHGLLLLLPAVDLTAVKPEEQIETEPEEAPVIEVQNLSELIGAEPEEAELPPPPEDPEPPPPETSVAPPDDIVITDVEDIPEDLPDEPDEPDEPNEPDEPDDEPEQPPFDGAAARAQAADRTRTLGETTPPAPLLLDEDQRSFFFDMANGTKLDAPLIDGLTDLIVFNDATLAEKEQEILNSFAAGGDNPSQVGEYGDWPLYQLINVESNEEVGYLSVFQGTGGRTVLVGIWNSFPQ